MGHTAWNLPYDRAWEKAPPYDRAWKRPVIYLVFGHIYQEYIGLTAQYIVYKRKKYYIPGIYRIQEYMTVYTRLTVVLKRLCRYILMTCKSIPVYKIQEHCDVHCDVAVP